MGEVRRVFDRDLNRSMAMRILLPHAITQKTSLARFIEEAQTTAQLQHPGIVPVHEIGKLSDGRLYFTMQEVRGRTLSRIIEEVHDAVSDNQWQVSPTGWTFRRLIEAFRKVTEAVHFAHTRGVTHRDLKPSNIMVGDFGEVLVMDWGLAHIRGRPMRESSSPNQPPPQTEQVITLRSRHAQLATQVGTVAGTPSYMCPEQARGELEQVGPTWDVYALGAILYEILAGHAPYTGPDALSILMQVLHGPPPPPVKRARQLTQGETVAMSTLDELPFDAPPSSLTPPTEHDLEGPALPEELLTMCLKAMAREPHERYPNAGELSETLMAWLEGSQRREQALRIVEQAEQLRPEIEGLQAQARSLRQQATRTLRDIKAWESIDKKRPGWQLEAEAQALERTAAIREAELIKTLQGALTYAPELAEIHQRLADYYQEKHAQAELSRDFRTAAQLEVLLRAHDRGAYRAYLSGEGSFTLITEPAGAVVTVYRCVERDRRLELDKLDLRLKTPLKSVRLAPGSYVLELSARGRRTTHYPIQLRRQEHWDGVRPGDRSPYPIYLPRLDELADDDCYVPAGWFWCGEEQQAFDELTPQRVWVDGFVIKRFPVTNREYLHYLNTLRQTGRLEEALRQQPRQRSGPNGQEGPPVYGTLEDGTFCLVRDAEGDLWHPEWPVVLVTWSSAHAYSAWQAEQANVGWRLPGELEYEKAGRGVDGRHFPWGDFGEPTCFVNLDAFQGKAVPAEVSDYRSDVSPYGVTGLAGNTRSWCLEAYQPTGPQLQHQLYVPELHDPSIVVPRCVRGGNFMLRAPNGRVAGRSWGSSSNRSSMVGLRLVRSFPSRT